MKHEHSDRHAGNQHLYAQKLLSSANGISNSLYCTCVTVIGGQERGEYRSYDETTTIDLRSRDKSIRFILTTEGANAKLSDLACKQSRKHYIRASR